MKVDIAAAIDTVVMAENLELDFALELHMIDFEHDCYCRKDCCLAFDLDCSMNYSEHAMIVYPE